MLQPITNGEYLHEMISKYSSIGDYEIKNDDVCAVYLDSVAPSNFVAKFKFVDLCTLVRSLAGGDDPVYYPFRTIREATVADDNMFPVYAADRIEKKFSVVVIIGECSEKAISKMQNNRYAMTEHQVVAGGGPMRQIK